jgi:hypothetical protein
MSDSEAEPTGSGEQSEGGPGEDPAELDLDAVADELAAAEGFAEEHVQRALAPYRGMYPPEVLEEWEDDLRCFLLTHPVASQMLARIRPRAERSTSGEGTIMNAISDAPIETSKGRIG